MKNKLGYSETIERMADIVLMAPGMRSLISNRCTTVSLMAEYVWRGMNVLMSEVVRESGPTEFEPTAKGCWLIASCMKQKTRGTFQTGSFEEPTFQWLEDQDLMTIAGDIADAAIQGGTVLLDLEKARIQHEYPLHALVTREVVRDATATKFTRMASFLGANVDVLYDHKKLGQLAIESVQKTLGSGH